MSRPVARFWHIGFVVAEGQRAPSISTGGASAPASIDFQGVRLEAVNFMACGMTQEELHDTLRCFTPDDEENEEAIRDARADASRLREKLAEARKALKTRDDRIALAQLLTTRGISYLEVLQVGAPDLAEAMRLTELGVGGHSQAERDRLWAEAE